MLKQNKELSLSDRYNKNKKGKKYIISNEAISSLKDKKNIYNQNLSNDNKSIDILTKTTNLFDIIKLKEKSNNKNKYTNNINEIKNSEILSKRIYQSFFSEDKKQKIRKIILSKKNLLKEILNDEYKNELKEKNHKKINNFNSYNSIFKNKNSILINNISKSEAEIKKNKIYLLRNDKKENYDNENNPLNLKGIESHNKKILQEKLYQIKMNKIALIKKIKYEGLKKFCCKDIKFNYNKKFCSNTIEPKIENHKHTKFIKNELIGFENIDNINNCNEITINSLKEKVRHYFIGKFNNIKEYFDDWDEKGLGKITINDMYKYLNNKIKFKISKDEIRKLIGLYFKKIYLDLPNFKFFFFEQPSNEKISFQFNKTFFEKKEKISKSTSDRYIFIKNRDEDKLLFYKNCKYKELLDLIIEQKDKLLNEENKKGELNYNDFYNLINNIIKENKKINFDNEIRKVFIDYKIKNDEIINITDLIDKIIYKINSNNLRDINKNESMDIKKIINPGFSTFYGKIQNKNNINNINYRNINNLNDKKESIFSKTNYIFNKTKSYEENKNNHYKKLGNQIKEYKIQDTKLKKIKEPIKFNSYKTCNEKTFKDILSMTHENLVNNTIYIPKFRKYQLPKISKNTRERNKNSDIINLL